MDELALLDRQSSIENEPRTLNISQIQFAREAALYVVNTRSIEEALTIFTEGLVPVVRCGGDGRLSDCSGREGSKYCYWNSDGEMTGGISAGIRDIVSAPF